MIIEVMEVGPIMANCYIVACEDTKEALIIDPGDEAERIMSSLEKPGYTAKYIINTHGHFDHVGANKKIKEMTKAPILIHGGDAPMLQRLSSDAVLFGLSVENSPDADKLVSEGEKFEFGKYTVKVLHTPGHSPGGISLLIDDCVFVGDTLFFGSIGRTDLPGGDYETLIQSVRTKLFELPDETRVFCGHGPETTIGREKRQNPFFR